MSEDIQMFESSNIRRDYEITIVKFKEKTKVKTSKSIDVDLLSTENLDIAAEIYPDGDSNTEGHVGFYLRNNSSVSVILNYSVGVGNHISKVEDQLVEEGADWGWRNYLSHKDRLVTDKMVFKVKLHVVKKAVVHEAMGLWQQVSQIDDNVEALKEDLASLKATTAAKFEALDVTIQTCPTARPIPCPECPICMDDMKPPTKIMQCKGGHLICEKCKSRPSVQFCPTCREEFTGRAVGIEGYLRQLFGNN